MIVPLNYAELLNALLAFWRQENTATQWQELANRSRFCFLKIPESGPSHVLVLGCLWLVRGSNGIFTSDILVVEGILLVAEVVVGLEASCNE